jgi:uncharacterized membrane-anchored protein
MSNRRSLRLAVACLLLAVCAPVLAAHHRLTSEQAHALLESLHFQQGSVDVPKAHAHLELTPGFSYLDSTDARKVLEQLWDNPPDTSTLGMIVHGTDTHALTDPDAYAVIISYSNDGYISDSDAGDINYDKLLSRMQKATRESNPQRRKQGYPELTLVGWAEPPHYDHASHKLYWAKDLRVDDGARGDALNYDIRALGRHGYLSLSAIAGMGNLDTVKAGMQQILPMVHFDPGSRYVDFDSKTDRVAAYGISALIAGTLAAKAGLFAKLFAVLLAAKKAILAGLAAAAAFFRKLFRRKKA